MLSIVASGDETASLRRTAAIALGAALEQAGMERFDDPDDVPISEATFLKTQASLHRLFMDAESDPRGNGKFPGRNHIDRVRSQREGS